MANFSSGWNFSPANWAEILLRLHDEPGWNISLGAKYEIVRKQSQENQNGAGNTNRENRRIVSFRLTVRNGTKRNETVLCETVLCEMVLCETVLCETVWLIILVTRFMNCCCRVLCFVYFIYLRILYILFVCLPCFRVILYSVRFFFA